MNKSIILFSYGTALYFILRQWYKLGNQGIPTPSVLAPPTYLYGILALSSDFLGGAVVFLAVSLTFGLVWGIQDVGTQREGTTTLSKIIGHGVAPRIRTPQGQSANKRNQRTQQNRTVPTTRGVG